MERLEAEFHKNREKLIAYLEADLKRTAEDMEKLRSATSNAARAARAKLSAKYQDLKARLEHLAREHAPEE